jgi:hypothetical protein
MARATGWVASDGGIFTFGDAQQLVSHLGSRWESETAEVHIK